MIASKKTPTLHILNENWEDILEMGGIYDIYYPNTLVPLYIYSDSPGAIHAEIVDTIDDKAEIDFVEVESKENTSEDDPYYIELNCYTFRTEYDDYSYVTLEITIDETDDYAAYSELVEIDTHPGTGSGSVTVSNFIYNGNKPSPVPKSTTNGISNVSYTYYNSSKTQLSSIPYAAGSYYIKATFPQTDYYNEYVTDYVAFTISKKTLTFIWSPTS